MVVAGGKAIPELTGDANWKDGDSKANCREHLVGGWW